MLQGQLHHWRHHTALNWGKSILPALWAAWLTPLLWGRQIPAVPAAQLLQRGVMHWTSSAHTYQRMWARNKPPGWENHPAGPCCKPPGLSTQLWPTEQEILKHHLCCPQEKTTCSTKDLELLIDAIQPWSTTSPHKQQQLLEILPE